ncbi:MAG TPA: hypothetical protein VIL34_15940 [Actinopolymorphaceae bacterium]|jgi:hypothetical protein
MSDVEVPFEDALEAAETDVEDVFDLQPTIDLEVSEADAVDQRLEVDLDDEDYG